MALLTQVVVSALCFARQKTLVYVVPGEWDLKSISRLIIKAKEAETSSGYNPLRV